MRNEERGTRNEERGTRNEERRLRNEEQTDQDAYESNFEKILQPPVGARFLFTSAFASHRKDCPSRTLRDLMRALRTATFCPVCHMFPVPGQSTGSTPRHTST
eukprot:scaffold3274_cov244-Pinguiococcus_pyrenoidosus.AAC.11